jgi:hypothetical protein
VSSARLCRRLCAPWHAAVFRGRGIRDWRLYIAIAGLIFGACHSPVAADEATLRRFQQEYPAAARRLQDFYVSCRMGATEERTTKLGQPLNSRAEYARNGEHFREIVTCLESPVATQVGYSNAILNGLEGAFFLKRFPRTDTYILDEVLSRAEALRILRDGMMPAFAPFSILGKPLTELMQESQFAITSAEIKNTDQGSQVRIGWKRSFIHPKDGKLVNYGWIDLLPSDGWAIREYELAVGTDQIPFVHSSRVRVDYGKKIDAIPIVVGVSYWRERGMERTRSDEKRFVDISFSKETVPDDEFTLASFGVKQENSRPRFWPLIVAIAVVVIGISAFFRRRFIRSRGTRPV